MVTTRSQAGPGAIAPASADDASRGNGLGWARFRLAFHGLVRAGPILSEFSSHRKCRPCSRAPPPRVRRPAGVRALPGRVHLALDGVRGRVCRQSWLWPLLQSAPASPPPQRTGSGTFPRVSNARARGLRPGAALPSCPFPFHPHPRSQYLTFISWTMQSFYVWPLNILADLVRPRGRVSPTPCLGTAAPHRPRRSPQNRRPCASGASPPGPRASRSAPTTPPPPSSPWRAQPPSPASLLLSPPSPVGRPCFPPAPYPPPYPQATVVTLLFYVIYATNRSLVDPDPRVGGRVPLPSHSPIWTRPTNCPPTCPPQPDPDTPGPRSARPRAAAAI